MTYWIRKCVIAGLLMLMAGSAYAADPATAPATAPATLSDHDHVLLHQLESGAWRDRKSAEAELSARPAEDVPVIRAMLALTKNADAAARLNAVLAHLNNVKEIGATLITLHMTDAPAKAVYSELFRQAGGTLRTNPANLLDDPAFPKLSIDVDRQPFWVVMEQLQRTGKLEPALDADGGFCLFRSAETIARPHVISGAFLVEIAEHHNGTNPGNYLHLVLMIYPEPRLHAAAGVKMKADRAVDDKGNALERGMAQVPLYIANREAIAAVNINPADKNPGKQLIRLAATITVPVILHSDHIDVGDLMNAAPRNIQAGPLAVKFEGCKKVNGSYQVTFSSGPDPLNRLSQIFQGQNAQVRVLDADGHEMPQTGMGNMTGPDGNSVIYIYGTQPVGPQRANPPPEPKRMICDVPTAIRDVDVPVDFKNLNLPLGPD